MGAMNCAFFDSTALPQDCNLVYNCTDPSMKIMKRKYKHKEKNKEEKKENRKKSENSNFEKTHKPKIKIRNESEKEY